MKDHLKNKYTLDLKSKEQLFIKSMLEGWSLTLSRHKAGLTKSEFKELLSKSDMIHQLKDAYMRDFYKSLMN